MLRRWLAGRTSPPESPRVPDGRRVYAVGDIHGRDDLLERLLMLVAADDAARPPAATTAVFLGDYVDRGPASRTVIDRLMALDPADAVFLSGNHEEVLLLAAEGDARAAGLLDRIGGRETLASYGVSDAAFDAADPEGLAALAASVIPATHLDWLRGLALHHRIGDYLFVHAGIRPGVPIAEQSPADLRWIRGIFLDHRAPHDGIVVHGHSITPEVEMLDNRIGIDTGAYATGRLTALGLEGTQRWVIQTEAMP